MKQLDEMMRRGGLVVACGTNTPHSQCAGHKHQYNRKANRLQVPVHDGNAGHHYQSLANLPNPSKGPATYLGTAP